MTLPFPTSNIMTAVMRYDIHNLPVTLNIVTIPQIQHLVPSMTMAVINRAGEIAGTTRPRTFCYNMISNNYFRNQDLLELVTLAVDFLALGFMKGQYTNPEASINYAAEHALTLYISNLIVKFRELEYEIDQRTIDAAYQNNSALSNMKNEINNMYLSMNNPQNNMIQSNYPNGQQMNMGFNQPMQTAQSFPQSNMMGRQPMSMPGRTTLQPGQMTAFGNRPTTISMQPKQDASFNLSQDRYMKRKKAPKPIEHVEVNTAELVSEPVTQEANPDSKLHQIAGSTMNREQHRTVFNDKFEMNQRRVVKHNDQAIKLDAEAAQQASANNDFVGEQVTSTFVYPKWVYDNFLETAINQGLVKKLSQNAVDIYRTFNIIGVPFISKYDLKPYMDVVNSSDTFISLANKMQTLVGNLNLETDKDKASSMMSFLSQLDIILTKIVNDFLEYSLNPGGRIDSFMNDIITLRDDLVGAYGAHYGKALDIKESEVMDILFNLEMTATGEQAVDSLPCVDIPKGLFCSTLNMSYSITYLGITDKELGVNVAENRIIIDKTAMPDLWAIVNSLSPHKTSLGAATIGDLLVTSDGVQYRLYTSYTNTDYKIVKL